MTEDGKVEIVDIRFGNTIYRNVSVNRLEPIDEASHSHPRSGKELDDKKKKRNKMTKEIAEQKLNLFLEKNVPTNPAKWSYYKSQAKKKFDVYPSAYANAWAAKQYKAAGGGWRKTKG